MKKKQWLQDIKLHNPVSALPEEAATVQTKSPTNRIPKPPPIYIDAKIIDPLIELLNNPAGKDNYVIKQVKLTPGESANQHPRNIQNRDKITKGKKRSVSHFSAQN